MIRSRFGLLGICAVVFGLMALSATAAQAAKWLILNSAGTVATELKAGVKGVIDGTEASLLSKILGIEVEILCTGAELIGVNLELSGALTTGGKVKFTGCVTKLNKALAEECKPKSPGAALGTVETNSGKGKLVLNAAKTEGLTLIEPEVGETFVTLELGVACPVGNKVPVIGKLFAKDSKKLSDHEITRLITEDPATELWVISKTVEHKAFIDGGANISLTGAHLNLKWGGNAE